MDPNLQQSQQSDAPHFDTPKPAQQSTIQTKHHFSFPKLLFILLGIIVVLGLIRGAYYLGAKNTSSITKQNQIVISLTQNPQKPLNTPTSSFTLSFQNSIGTYCQKVPSSASSVYYALDLSKLPLKVDSQVVTPMTLGNNTPKCWGVPGQDYFFFQSTQGNSFDIFDDNSVEPGHGGYPVLKPIGTKIYDANGTTLYFIRGIAIGSYIGTEGIDIKGFKKLIWPTGQTIYITTGKQVISETDSRLLAILNKYAISATYYLPEDYMIVDPSKELQAVDDIKNTFFSNMNDLQSPERESINLILNELNAFSVR